MKNSPATSHKFICKGYHRGLTRTPSVDSTVIPIWLLLASLVIGAPDLACPLTRADGTGKFIAVPDRVDMAHDARRKLLYISAGPRVLRYDLEEESFRPPFEIGGVPGAVDLSPDGDFLAVSDTISTSDKAWIHLIDLRDGTSRKLIVRQSSSGYGTSDVAYGYDGSLVVVGEGLVRVEPGSGTVTDIRAYFRPALAASYDRRTIGVADPNSSRMANLYDVTTRALGGGTNLNGFNFALAVNRDGSQLGFSLSDGTVIFNNSFTQVAKIGSSGSAPVGVAFHPAREALFLPWSRTNQIRVYSTTSFQEITRIELSVPFDQYASKISISQDGALVFSTVPGGFIWFSHNLDIPRYAAISIQGIPAAVGTPQPGGYGTNYFVTGIPVTNSVPETAEFNGVRYRVGFPTMPGTPPPFSLLTKCW